MRVLETLGVYEALVFGREGLWSLRGGCRAIAMVDAKIEGSVLFGLSQSVYSTRPTGKKSVGNDNSDPATLRSGAPDGPSVVIGAIDMDRITVDGDIRLTGGIYRGVTPITGARRVEVEKCASSGEPVARRLSGPEISLSYPSTPGWTTLMARVCLSLRSATVKGCLESHFFGGRAL